MKHLRIMLPVLAAGTFAWLQLMPKPAPAAETPSAISAAFEVIAGREVHQPQFLVAGEGRALLVWREKGRGGSDLFAVALSGEAGPAAVVRINNAPGTVVSQPLDEVRAGLAAGPDSRVAVAWSNKHGQVRVAESRDGGATFSRSRRLDQTRQPAPRYFPQLAYDGGGVLHATWLDSRFAENLAEEPADLFYARITPEAIQEVNLTAAQEASVCGCCRPSLQVSPAGHVRIAFRNTTLDGYRDIFTIEGDSAGGFGAPQPIGPPLWKLQACPVSGPILVGDLVLWPDGSTGKKLLRRGTPGGAATELALMGIAPRDWKLRIPPRRVESASGEPLLLIPGLPSSLLARPRDGGQTLEVLEDDLPVWATSALAAEGGLWLVGAVNGELFHEKRPLT